MRGRREIQQVNALSAQSRRNLDGADAGAEADATARERTKAESGGLMEAVCATANVRLAYKRVVQNKGSAGVDGITWVEFEGHLKQHWPTIRGKLLAGSYVPSPVRRVEIAKPQGGTRTLGIPTLTDRLIQQALHQVLSPIFEARFSESSYGFRPGRGAHQAVEAARGYVAEGYRVVVDMDLEQFFDRVNHDVLMGKLAKEIDDKRVLRLVRRYLRAGMMAGGLVSPRREGTPQGGPLSPLLSNILLTDLDRELERRGHRFCRYADDCNIYVKSQAAGERVLASLTRFLEQRLKLKVNTTKSAVAAPRARTFLGYSLTGHRHPKLRIAPASSKRLRAKVRKALKGKRGGSVRQAIDALNPLLRGWAAYFRLAETKRPLEELDQWVRHRLRCLIWRHWKHAPTRARNLIAAGLAPRHAGCAAYNGRGPWWNSGSRAMNFATPKQYFDRLGLVSLLATVRRLQGAS